MTAGLAHRRMWLTALLCAFWLMLFGYAGLAVCVSAGVLVGVCAAEADGGPTGGEAVCAVAVGWLAVAVLAPAAPDDAQLLAGALLCCMGLATLARVGPLVAAAGRWVDAAVGQGRHG